MLRIGIVAGEASGDYLAADLIESIKSRNPDVTVEGIGGPRLQALGCRSLFPMEKLAVMGLVEVLGSYWELLNIRRKLIKHFLANPPDVFIGVDAPDFNLGMEQVLRQQGIKVAHYVSPSVWAWRSYRVKKIVRSVDLILALFPFEKGFYEKHKIPVKYVGHPLAQKINMQADRSAAKQRLGLANDKTVIALMPGSRGSELKHLVPVFLEAAALVQKSNVHFVSSLLTDKAISYFEEMQGQLSLDNLPLTLYQNRTDDVLEAADLALLASGTITLEAMLYKCPMVVAYKLNWLTHRIVLALAEVENAALPNLLAGELIVPECLQDDCYPEKLAEELMKWLNDPEACNAVQARFVEIHKELKLESNKEAADAVLELLESEVA